MNNAICAWSISLYLGVAVKTTKCINENDGAQPRKAQLKASAKRNNISWHQPDADEEKRNGGEENIEIKGLSSSWKNEENSLGAHRVKENMRKWRKWKGNLNIIGVVGAHRSVGSECDSGNDISLRKTLVMKTQLGRRKKNAKRKACTLKIPSLENDGETALDNDSEGDEISMK